MGFHAVRKRRPRATPSLGVLNRAGRAPAQRGQRRPCEGLRRGRVAKASEEDATPSLRQQGRGVELARGHSVACGAKGALHRRHHLGLEQTTHVLEQQCTEAARRRESHELVEELTAVVVEGELTAGVGEGLAREARHEHVGGRDRRRRLAADVTDDEVRRVVGPVEAVRGLCEPVRSSSDG